MAGTAALCVERRLFVRECDCFCLGTAMRRERIAGAMPRTHPSPKWIRALKDGVTVVDSRRALCVWRDPGPPYPVYAFPAADVTGVEAAPLDDVPDHVTVRWDAVDEWLEDDEPLVAHARDPFARIDVRRSSRHVVIEHDGEAIADSRRPLLLYETGLPVRCYLPVEDVRMDLLEPSATVTQCAYKGTASHHAHRGVDVAWVYPEVLFDGPPVAGLAGFYDERLDITVDGERQQRPDTPWSV